MWSHIHPHWVKKTNAKVYTHFFKKMKKGRTNGGEVGSPGRKKVI